MTWFSHDRPWHHCWVSFYSIGPYVILLNIRQKKKYWSIPFVVVVGTYLPVWPDWAILKGLGTKLSYKKKPKRLATFGLFWKSNLLGKSCPWHLFGPRLQYIWLLFIPTSGHTATYLQTMDLPSAERAIFYGWTCLFCDALDITLKQIHHTKLDQVKGCHSHPLSLWFVWKGEIDKKGYDVSKKV